jgi:AcrR family transcriptional regulator
MARPYELKKRAERQEQTRLRIVEAAVALHGEVGPARTTVSAIAERAGVERHTYYRHFPDERSLFLACSGHFTALHPLPDPAPLRAISDPHARLRRGLAEVYAYYARHEGLFANITRDAAVHAPTAEAHALRTRPQVEAIRAALAVGLAAGRNRSRTLAALDVALDFATWETLTAGNRLTDRAAANLMARMVGCSVGGD